MRGVGHGAGNREGAFGGRARGSDEARPKHKSLAGKQQRKFRVDNAFWKPRRTTTRTRHFPRWIFKWMRGIFTRPRRTTAAIVCRSSTQEAIPRLPDHLVVTHILRSENFDDPADLARLPAVSCAMRAAVAATGLQFEELDEHEAVDLGCLSALQRRQRGGRLSRQEYLCAAAARSGQLEKLKGFRENGCPWEERTCSRAAHGGHLELLSWHARTAARGTQPRACTRQRAGTSKCCSGRV